jgi:hypothetical protein
MAKIGLTTEEISQMFSPMIPNLEKYLTKQLTDDERGKFSSEQLATITRLIASTQGWMFSHFVKIIEDNNTKIYQDLMKEGIVKPFLEEVKK